MASDIQVSVRFREQCVFAGEEMACTITFKNVAEMHLNTPTIPGSGHPGRRGSISQLAALSLRGGRGMQKPRVVTNFGRAETNSHKTTMSLGTPLSTASETVSPKVRPTWEPSHKHQRSLSIIAGPRNAPAKEKSADRGLRPTLGHERSSTMDNLLGSRNGSIGATQRNGLQIHGVGSSRSPFGSPASLATLEVHSRESTPEFTFPTAVGRSQLSEVTTESRATKAPLLIGKSKAAGMPGSSVADSNRSSAEYHSLSNHSQETLMSEEQSVSDMPQFLLGQKQYHHHMVATATKMPTTAKLLMGYAQVNATFTLDSSLVDPSPFEEVKRKGFLGGQAGGGVVGVKKPQPSTGIFGGLGLNSITESIGSLMSGTELSSVKEMKEVASSRSIPLLSTPQSLLFVDLQLALGEERSYAFAYVLPRGLPASHRGKAIRIVYNLIVGVQGAPGARDVQTMRHVKLPIRVFPGVDSQGEILGHDLMQPHVILRDEARTAAVESDSAFLEHQTVLPSDTIEASAKGFLEYAENLLERNKRRQSSSGTLTTLSQERPDFDIRNAKGAISRAILYSNQVAETSDTSPNKFHIARGGLRVAIVTLDRPLHRLGETITAVIDFSDGELLCLNIRATLETTEKVNSPLAVRSAASISRVTRKVYAAFSENTLFAQRVVFCLIVPVTATPTLLTSGVNLDWSLRFEFATARLPATLENEAPARPQNPELLEEIIADERGVMSAAVETIDYESFEVFIPITVFGDVIMDKEKDDKVISLLI